MNDRFLVHQGDGGGLVSVEDAGLIAPWSGFDGAPNRPGITAARLVNALYRWRWLFLAIFTAVVLAAGTWASFQTPLYKASATLELNPAPSQVVKTDSKDGDERAQPDRDFLALQLGLVKSRTLAERVVRSLNLTHDKDFLGDNANLGKNGDAATARVMHNFSATGTTSDRIMQITFVDRDPYVAAKVANGFAEQAIDLNFERSLGATARSREFLQQRLEATRRDLEKSERTLIDYARKANIINVVSNETPTSGDSAGGTLVASNLVALNQQLAEAQNARIVAQQKYAQAGAAAGAARASDGTAQALQQQRAQLQAEYDQKLQTYRPDYPEMGALRARISALDREIAASGSRASSAVVNSLRADMVAAENREHALQGRINQLQSQFLNLNDRGVQYTILKRSVDANRSMYNALLEQLGVENSSGTRTSSISVVDQAQVPKAPFSPNIPRVLLLAILAGLALGAAGVLGAEAFYDKVNTPEDVKELGLAVLGVVPATRNDELVDDLIKNPQSALAEAYHSARAALQFATAGAAPRSILFTSARASEGKTSSTIAIAADFTSIGKRVVVVDADLRKPSLRGESPGLSAVLAGACDLNHALLPTEHPSLFLVPAGRIPPNPTVLLTGQAFADLVTSLESLFDVVIFDGPPVLGFADAPLLSAVVEATVVVIAARTTSRSMVRNAVTRLQNTGGNIAGAILNKFDRKAAGLSYGENAYGYYAYEYGGHSPKRTLIAHMPAVSKDTE